LNKAILTAAVQNFIQGSWNVDVVPLLLKPPLFKGVSQKELVEQLEAKKKCRHKLPTWFDTKTIYYPNKINIEQTSSEATAAYKASLVSGKHLIDLTGGLGVDSWYFSKQMATVTHCEINEKLSQIAAHNFGVLETDTINCLATDGLEALQQSGDTYDWVYVDPSRRDGSNNKVFLLKDSIPNLPKHLSAIFEKADQVLVKTSPLLDISQGLEELSSVKEVHVLAVANEVKELLWVLQKGYSDEPEIKAVNLQKKEQRVFGFRRSDEKALPPTFGLQGPYLYEPNAAIMKSGGFKSVAKAYGLLKLAEHSHLYTSEKLIAFPGRCFEIRNVIGYSKSGFKSLGISKANVTTRNFTATVAEIRKKFKITDGGTEYLFFTTDHNSKRLVIQCKRV